jgi:predicted MFS family arabinose efflux permease
VALTVISLLTCAAVIALLPREAARDGAAAHGVAPDPRRYWLVVTVTALGVAGYFTTFTYVTAYLVEVSGWPASALGPLLFVAGLAGLVGVGGVGLLVDRHPRATIVLALAVMAVAALGLVGFGSHRVPAILFTAAGSLGLSAFAPAVANRVMHVAPGSTDLANAGVSSAFNVGIAGGSLCGGVLVEAFGVRSVAVIGGLVTTAALVLALGDRYLPQPGNRLHGR